jgi:hypothetical protein
MTIISAKGSQFELEFGPDDSLLIHIRGCGTFGENRGAPILVKTNWRNDKPILYVWADINQEDPTHEISLEGAMEDDQALPS